MAENVLGELIFYCVWETFLTVLIGMTPTILSSMFLSLYIATAVKAAVRNDKAHLFSFSFSCFFYFFPIATVTAVFLLLLGLLDGSVHRVSSFLTAADQL